MLEKLSDPCDYCETKGIVQVEPEHWVECRECHGAGYIATAAGAQILLLLTQFGYVTQDQLVGLKKTKKEKP